MNKELYLKALVMLKEDENLYQAMKDIIQNCPPDEKYGMPATCQESCLNCWEQTLKET